jgi:hypothetical protein
MAGLVIFFARVRRQSNTISSGVAYGAAARARPNELNFLGERDARSWLEELGHRQPVVASTSLT